VVIRRKKVYLADSPKRFKNQGGVRMKSIKTVAVGIAFLAGIMLICSDMAFAAKDKAAKDEKKVEEKKAEEPKAKVVCKFKNKDQMAEFEQLYVAKQATFGRMGVLQAYFTMEQNNIQEIDKQLEEKFKFKMDPNKMYDLNRETMEIKEVGAAAQPTQQ